MTSIIIVWICIAILIAIFIIALVGIFHANKANREAMSIEKIACAGSVDTSYPATVKIKIPNDPFKTIGGVPRKEMEILQRFVVKGNSMQYASINSDDLIYVREMDVEALRHILPKVTLLKFNAGSTGMTDRKIRRTWSVIDSDISDAKFESILDSVLAKEQFNELRKSIGDKCPSDKELRQSASDSLNRYRKILSLGTETPSKELLLSTTFRTERNLLEFSVHPSSALQGIVAYVSHPLRSA